MGVKRIFGSVGAGVARGLALRMDHGAQYLSDDFLNQVRVWGVKASFAFVEEPQTNGVAERFNRTLKEQVVFGRVGRRDGRRASRSEAANRRSIPGKAQIDPLPPGRAA